MPFPTSVVFVLRYARTPFQNLAECDGVLAPMLNDDHREGNQRRQLAQDRADCVQTTGGNPDHYDIARHYNTFR